MKLFKFKYEGSDIFVPDCYPFSVKNGSLEYFIKGWKKTKKYEVVAGVELPDKWDKNVTWLDVARLYDQYGIQVANVFADCKTAGIVSKQTAIGYGLIYGKIKHLIDDNFDSSFFELLRCDYTTSCFGMFIFDVVGLDSAFEQLEKIIPDYLFKDKSHGRFDWIEPKERGARAWRFNDNDDWNYDFAAMPPVKVYDATQCTYKGAPASMREYVEQRWGENYVKIIETLNEKVVLNS